MMQMVVGGEYTIILHGGRSVAPLTLVSETDTHYRFTCGDGSMTLVKSDVVYWEPWTGSCATCGG